MKLNGVIILRITDFRRFFDFVSFWGQKEKFIQLVKPLGRVDHYFFDTDKEKILGSVVCKWIEGRPELCVAEITNNALVITVGLEKVSYPLNNKLKQVYDLLKQNNVKPLQTVGLLALYKILGADNEDSGITISVSECLRTLNIGEVDFQESYIPLVADKEIPFCKKEYFPLVAKTIVNKSGKSIRLIHDGKSVELRPQQCIVGVFHENECYKLLQRIGKNQQDILELSFNDSNKNTDLIITNVLTGQRNIENVISFYIDDLGYTYVKSDGECVVDKKAHWNIYSTLRNLHFSDNEFIFSLGVENTITQILTNLNEY